MYIHIKTCIWMLIAALSIISLNWKKPRCSWIGEWINSDKFSRGILFSDKKKKLSSHVKKVKTSMNLKSLNASLMLSETSVWKVYILHDSIYTIICNRQKHWNGKQNSGCQVFKVGLRLHRWSIDFCRVVKLFCTIP